MAELKLYKSGNGLIYRMPKNHCVFCEHCTDIFYDYTNGPYMFICDKGCRDFKTCNNFKEE